MLKIGEFSKLCQMTVKALRFYEKEGLLIPASVADCISSVQICILSESRCI